MSDREWHWQNATGCSTQADASRLLLEQAEQLRQKDAALADLATALEGMTHVATGLHIMYRKTAKTESDGSHEKAFSDALALVKKVRTP
jgi:hypothetical protein